MSEQKDNSDHYCAIAVTLLQGARDTAEKQWARFDENLVRVPGSEVPASSFDLPTHVTQSLSKNTQ